MPNPWEPPLFPDHGDNDNKTLFESIGRALTAWEDLESFVCQVKSKRQFIDMALSAMYLSEPATFVPPERHIS
jgi:hypothetical protein